MMKYKKTTLCNEKFSIPSDMNEQQKKSFFRMINSKILVLNLVCIQGLPEEYFQTELLSSKQFLGQYGEIESLILSRLTYHSKKMSDQKSLVCHVTYSKKQSAALAINAINGFEINDSRLSASYGFSKYCSYFIRNRKCPDKNCKYIHHLVDSQYLYDKRIKAEKESITQRFQDFSEYQLNQKYSDMYFPKNYFSIFPTPQETIEKKVFLVNNSYKDTSNQSQESMNQKIETISKTHDQIENNKIQQNKKSKSTGDATDNDILRRQNAKKIKDSWLPNIIKNPSLLNQQQTNHFQNFNKKIHDLELNRNSEKVGSKKIEKVFDQHFKIKEKKTDQATTLFQKPSYVFQANQLIINK